MGCDTETLPGVRQISPQWSTVAFIGLVIVSFIGIIVNGSTLIVIFKQKSRSLNNKSIIPAIFFLSLSDFLICSFTLPIQAARFNLRQWPFDLNWGCKSIAYINHLLFALSVSMITLIVINRAVALYSSKSATKYFSWRNILVTVMLIALFEGIFLLIPFLTSLEQYGRLNTVTEAFSWNRYDYVKGTFSCTIVKNQGDNFKVPHTC